jgi:hypothetical protein
MRALLLPLVGDGHKAGACRVIGRYGDSRERELIFGGAIRHLLHHHDLPVLITQ